MGEGLGIGVATQIYIEKYSKYKMHTKDEILEIIKKDINLNHYDVLESEMEIHLRIKENILIKHLYDLLKTETTYKTEKEENLNLVLERIKEAKNLEEIEMIIEDNGSSGIQIISNPFGGISYINDWRLEISAVLISYTSIYKAYLEYYGDMLDYIRKK